MRLADLHGFQHLELLEGPAGPIVADDAHQGAGLLVHPDIGGGVEPHAGTGVGDTDEPLYSFFSARESPTCASFSAADSSSGASSATSGFFSAEESSTGPS